MRDKIFRNTIWSAAPTPFDRDGELDLNSLRRLADHHYALGISGVFIGGTAGEGPLLPRRMLFDLAAETVKANAGRMKTALQITDNSAERMLENIRCFVASGVDMFVIAPPFVCMKPDQDYLFNMYRKVIDASPLPVGLYHQGKSGAVSLAPETVSRLMLLPNVVFIKDSACNQDDTRAILGMRDRMCEDKAFSAYSGDEFNCVGAAQQGYDGMMIGAGCFNGRMAKSIFELVHSGNIEDAKRLQARLNTLMYDCFGGPDIPCWLAGEKQMLVEMGIFCTNSCLMNYHLTGECAEAIRAAAVREAEWLYPQQEALCRQ